MNTTNTRRNVFIVTSFILAFTLVISIWRHASAAQVEADGATARHLAELCSEVGKVDSSVLAQVAKLAPLFTFQPDEGKTMSGDNIPIFVRRNDMQVMSNDIATLARNLDWLKNSLNSINVDELNGKTDSMPALTEACLAAVTSVRQPIHQIRDEVRDLRNQLTDLSGNLQGFRKELIAASRAPFNTAINDLPMLEIYSVTIAAIGSSAETIDQNSRRDFYRHVLTETPSLEWLTLSGTTLTVSPELLGMDIILRIFSGDNDVCQTKLVRFSHCESLIVPADTRKIIAFFCKPEVMKNPRNYDREANGVRFVGKQMITVPTPAPEQH